MTTHNSAIFDVVIAGLGPTGATLAHLLGKRGLSVLVLEREPVFYGNARAVYTDDECMRVMQAAGVAAELATDMQIDTPAQWTFPDGRVIGRYWQLKRSFGWPVINFLYQPWLETKLSDMLSRYPSVQVVRGRELVDFQQDGELVTLTHQATQNCRFGDGDGSRIDLEVDLAPATVTARYLVGADGGRSTVREKLGIGMDGKNFPEPWLVVDLDMKEGEDALRHIPYFNFICDPDCPVVSCPQPGRFHRFEFMLMPGQTKEYMEDPATVRQLLSRYVDPDKFEVKRKLVYTFNALVAREWRKGRVLLAGDAAHMTPQFMGQGMSSGVRDAYNLAWKLEAVLRGKAAEQLLDTYGSERYHHAKAMIDISVQMKDFVSMSNPFKTALRNFTVKALNATPVLGKWLREGGFKPTPTYKPGSYLGLPRSGRRDVAGKLLPQPEVRTFKGKRVPLDEVLGEGFALLGLENNPRVAISAEHQQFLSALDTRYVTLFPFGGRPQGMEVQRFSPAGLVEVEEPAEDLVRWFKRAGRGSNLVAVVRPDKFVFALVPAEQLNTALSELKRQLGWQPNLAASQTNVADMRKSA
ncbi:bifunctional 3-(3-hydroxy-phenyl)propionate/3-hydroxycinnamic acid hydroxylase [Pseudomonas sp. PDM16]|uniref:bifunctional 3-(3-hydroxy-phenyl)propionate/3-hydroxycinnamic acid hydroxylase MhpA n=1 Tax=Pseudomonas sp. PDM16 TaxID=2769292 RepID=UPI001780A7BB|nr:bifunctional 3-(3-hydroxy-phenyl)propionate/3-hydroxycinnamic acid hydroxylase [Pseudomonas sp. PDM16]MBD9415976.1 bifunctional 3-(3-hydroxy-phenyl)propionate/3-hydroxycinnamic acid hydroxylase [Pseudomonas sp. PDM16]